MKIIAFKQVSYMKLIEAKNDKTDTKTGEYGVFAQTLVWRQLKKKKTKTNTIWDLGLIYFLSFYLFL